MNLTPKPGASLRHVTGAPPRMVDADGQSEDLSSTSLTRQESVQLVLPIMPELACRRLPQENSVVFDHPAQGGMFKVTVARNGPEVSVIILADGGPANAPATDAAEDTVASPAGPADPAAVAADAPPTSVVVVESPDSVTLRLGTAGTLRPS